MPKRHPDDPQTLPDTMSDPVHWAGHYWARQEFDGDEGRFLAMTSLLRLERVVVDTVETELKRHDLNLTDYLLLMTLQLSENGTRLISSLARSLLVHATTATLATDRLQARAMLFRSPHPTDRRATCVTITELGESTARGATGTLSQVDFGLRGTTPTSIASFTATLAQMREAVGDTQKS